MIVFVNKKSEIRCAFSVIGYQFPEIETGEDGNWLLLKLDLEVKDKRFVRVDPAITMFELEHLIEWFEDVSDKKIPRSTNLYFTEPNLQFELYGCRENIIRYGIKLCSEFKPDFPVGLWADWVDDEDDDEIEAVLVFENSVEEFKEFSAGLRNELARFPKRG